MRRRLYFLLPDVESTHKTVNELLLAHIEFRHMHVIARDSISLKGLPEANLLQKSDVVHGLESGMIIGGIIGVIAGSITMLFPEVSTLGGWLVLGCALFGAAMGAWLSSMIGSDVRNSRLKRFERPISEGQILLMVDIPKAMVDEVVQMVDHNHPEVHNEGQEPSIPAFP